MKKIFYLALIAPLAFASCQADQPERTDGKGAIVIFSAQHVELDPNVFTTRAAADVNQFTLTVTDEANPSNTISGLFSDFPNGTVDNLDAGSYTVSLTSHPDGFTPAFEDAMYAATETGVEIVANTNTRVKLEATQANAGIFFVYDESLYSRGGFSEVIPTITQQNHKLIYEGENHEARGYFNPGQVVLTLTENGQELTLAGETSKTLELDEQQLWQITLHVKGEGGSLEIEASVKVITDPTHFIEFEIGKETTGPDVFAEINMYDLTNTSATMNIVKVVDAEIISARYAIYTQGLVDEYLSLGYTLEEAIMMQGNDLTELDIELLNMIGEVDKKFNLSIQYTDYVAMVYVEIEGGERALTTLDFQTPEFDAPVTAQYAWNWYGNFNDDLTWYENPYQQTLDVRYHEYYLYGLILIDEGYVIYHMRGITDFSFLVNYDKENRELVAPGEMLAYTGNYLNMLALTSTLTDPVTGEETKYAAGLYVWDENMNLVDRGMVFNTDENGYVVSSKYHITYDMYLEDSDGSPEDFVMRYQVAPMNDPIGRVGAGSANWIPENMTIQLRDAAQKDGAVSGKTNAFVVRQ